MNTASLADDQHSIQITTEGVAATVSVDGTDITRSLAGYTLEHRAGQPPLLVLYARPTNEGTVFAGLAQVAVASEVPPTEAIVAFLDSVDPDRLLQAALNRDDLDGTANELTTAMLRQLKEWAAGR